ncbi:transcription factor glial cells missing 2-like [Haemaphysalis longicornis]
MTEACDTGSVHNHADWKIEDSVLPQVTTFDEYNEWPDGNCRYVYRPDHAEAQCHATGWAMRHGKNLKQHIYQKKCTGVLVCSLQCVSDTGLRVFLKPGVSAELRKRQEGEPCPNHGCRGLMIFQHCRGYRGNAVRHFWRHTDSAVFFEAQGFHDHPRPNPKIMRRNTRVESSDTGTIQRSAKEWRQDPLDGLVKEDKPECTPLPSFQQEFARFISSSGPVGGGASSSWQCLCAPFECYCGFSPGGVAGAVASASDYRQAADPSTTATMMSPASEMHGAVFEVMDCTLTTDGGPSHPRYWSSQSQEAASGVPAHSETGAKGHVVIPVSDPDI